VRQNVNWTIVLLALVGISAQAAEPRQMSWNDLSSLAGKNVRMVMPDGAVISGKPISVEPEALLMTIRQTSKPAAYPKGEFRVPRASLKAIEVRGKTVRYRVIGTALASTIGLAGGLVAGVRLSDPWWGSGHSDAGAWAALLGIWGGSTAGGYLLGNMADHKTTTVVVQQ
jgi:hypothetical protein